MCWYLDPQGIFGIHACGCENFVRPAPTRLHALSSAPQASGLAVGGFSCNHGFPNTGLLLRTQSLKGSFKGDLHMNVDSDEAVSANFGLRLRNLIQLLYHGCIVNNRDSGLLYLIQIPKQQPRIHLSMLLLIMKIQHDFRYQRPLHSG